MVQEFEELNEQKDVIEEEEKIGRNINENRKSYKRLQEKGESKIRP